MTLRQTLLLAALLWVAGADAQRGRRADVIAPTPAADRLAVADAHAALDAASWTSGLDLRCVGPTVMSGRVVLVEGTECGHVDGAVGGEGHAPDVVAVG